MYVLGFRRGILRCMTLERKKEIGISSVFGLYTLLFFLSMALLLYAGEEGPLALSIFVVFGAFVWIALFAVAVALLAQRTGMRLFLSVLPGLIVAGVGLMSFPSLIGAAVLMICLSIAQATIVDEMDEHTRFRVRTLFNHGIKLAVVGLLSSVIALTLPRVQASIRTGSLNVHPVNIDFAVKYTAPFLQWILPGFSHQTTVNDMIASRSDIAAIPEQGRSLLLSQISGRIGQTLTGQETLSTIIANYVNQYIRHIADGSGWLVVIVLTVVAFFIVRALGPIVTWPVFALCIVMFQIVKSIGLIRLASIQVTAERIQL